MRDTGSNTVIGKEGCAMAKHEKKLYFSFVNPNDTKSFEQEFLRILVDKLVAVHRREAAAIG